jgi:hypothetical protein
VAGAEDIHEVDVLKDIAHVQETSVTAEIAVKELNHADGAVTALKDEAGMTTAQKSADAVKAVENTARKAVVKLAVRDVLKHAVKVAPKAAAVRVLTNAVIKKDHVDFVQDQRQVRVLNLGTRMTAEAIVHASVKHSAVHDNFYFNSVNIRSAQRIPSHAADVIPPA